MERGKICRRQESPEQREAVLKLFRARLLHKKPTHRAELDVPESTSGMVKQTGAQNPRAKRRKTRTERDKLRATTAVTDTSKALSKEQQGRHAKSGDMNNLNDVAADHGCTNLTCRDKTAAFGRIVKKGTNNSQMKPYDIPANAMTANRMTVGLGIFNRGKVSNKIQRESLVMPNRVKEKADNDIKRVLDTLDDTLSNNRDDDILHLGGGDSNNYHSLSAKSSFSLPLSPVDDCLFEAIPAAVQSRHQNSSSNSLPPSPDMKQIAQTLASMINPITMFPSGNYFEEVRARLYRLYIQNLGNSSPTADLSLRIAVTPGGEEQNQPAPHTSNSQQVDTPAPQPEAQTATNENDVLSPSQGQTVPQDMETQNSHQAATSRCSQQHQQTDAEALPGNATLTEELSVPMEFKDMLEYNEKAMMLLQQKQQEQLQQQQLLQQQDRFNGLYFMDTDTTGCETGMARGDPGWQQYPLGYRPETSAMDLKYTQTRETYRHSLSSSLGTRAQEHAQGVRNAYSALAAQSRLGSLNEGPGTISHDHSYLHSAQHPHQLASHMTSGYSADAAVITEYNCNVLDTNCAVPHHLMYQEPRHQHQEAMALDLLDMLDHDPVRSNLQPARSQVYLSQPPAGAMVSSMGLRFELHESDGSPCWAAKSLTHHKPPEDSPTSPPRLYPQRLY